MSLAQPYSPSEKGAPFFKRIGPFFLQVDHVAVHGLNLVLDGIDTSRTGETDAIYLRFHRFIEDYPIENHV